MQVNKMSKSKKRICIGVAVSLFIIGLIAGIYVMSRNKIQVEVGESNGEIALACFKQVAGDSYVEEIASLKEAKETKGMPTAIIARSIKGKGVSFMENQASWHGVAPNDEQYELAMQDLEKISEELSKEGQA